MALCEPVIAAAEPPVDGVNAGARLAVSPGCGAGDAGVDGGAGAGADLGASLGLSAFVASLAGDTEGVLGAPISVRAGRAFHAVQPDKEMTRKPTAN